MVCGRGTNRKEREHGRAKREQNGRRKKTMRPVIGKVVKEEEKKKKKKRDVVGKKKGSLEEWKEGWKGGTMGRCGEGFRME